MIEINNLTTNPIDEEFLRKVGEKVLEKENKKKVELSVALVGRDRMRELNKRYRGKNRVTDVLAFPEPKVLLEKFGPGPAREISNLGEIIICLREVEKNAKKEGVTFEKELSTCLIHGILHLLGYDHERLGREAKKIEEKQNYYSKLCQETTS